MRQTAAIWISLSIVFTTQLPFAAFASKQTCIDQLTGPKKQLKPKAVAALVSDHLLSQMPVFKAEKMNFRGVEERDVYNISAPFMGKIFGKEMNMILGRVEPRANHNSEVQFFTETAPATFDPIAKAPKFKMEDPFFSFVNGELIIGGVQTQPNEEGELDYRTVFYRDHGKGIDFLDHLANGPWKMKDIRLRQLKSGKIIVVTRPQGKVGGRGKNAFMVIDTLADLNEKTILEAELIDDQVLSNEWIGSNEIYELPNDDIGALSHVAYYKNEATGERGYHITIYTLRHPEPIVILIRADLNEELTEAVAKRPDLWDVLFAGGMVFNSDGTVTLYIGVGDALAYRVTIPNPFLRFVTEEEAIRAGWLSPKH